MPVLGLVGMEVVEDLVLVVSGVGGWDGGGGVYGGRELVLADSSYDANAGQRDGVGAGS